MKRVVNAEGQHLYRDDLTRWLQETIEASFEQAQLQIKQLFSEAISSGRATQIGRSRV